MLLSNSSEKFWRKEVVAAAIMHDGAELYEVNLVIGNVFITTKCIYATEKSSETGKNEISFYSSHTSSTRSPSRYSINHH